jgi:hypothetical protein
MGVSGKAAFSKGELSLILSVYGARVQRGEWRDYAIDSLSDMAVFSVFRSAREQPLYTITKIPSRSFTRPPRYAVHADGKALKEGTSLRDVLEVFEDA